VYTSNKKYTYGVYHKKPKKNKYAGAKALGLTTSGLVAAIPVTKSAAKIFTKDYSSATDVRYTRRLRKYAQATNRGLRVSHNTVYLPISAKRLVKIPAAVIPKYKPGRLARTFLPRKYLRELTKTSSLVPRTTLVIKRGIPNEAVAHELGHLEKMRKYPKHTGRISSGRLVSMFGVLPSIGLTYAASKKPFKSEKANRRLAYTASGLAGATALGAAHGVTTEIGANMRGYRIMKKLKIPVNWKSGKLLALGVIQQGLIFGSPAAGVYYYKRKKLGKVKISRKER
jgi:hypothetical protein